jgi:hypothetical protein
LAFIEGCYEKDDGPFGFHPTAQTKRHPLISGQRVAGKQTSFQGRNASLGGEKDLGYRHTNFFRNQKGGRKWEK